MGLRHFCVVLLGLGLAGTALASQGVVEATGEAQIKGSEKVKAKQEATADALKKCIEQVVGISIKSDFSSEQQETVKNNESAFMSQVRDSLVQKSEGFIQKYDVLEEKVEGDIFKVKVRAHVYESKIKAEVQKLADLIKAAGNPKLMLVIQEVYVSPDGQQRVGSDSILGSYIEKELLARGFELRGQAAAKAVARDTPEAFNKWLEDAGGAGQKAREEGADILIAGRVEIKNQGEIQDTGGLDALKGQIRVELSSVVRGINAASGEMLSSKPVQMKSMGTSEERAVHRAFQGGGKNLVKQIFGDLLEDLKESFKKTAEQGQQYVVQLGGVQSFRKQGQRFLDVLKGVSGVQSVKQKSFDNGNLVVEVACKCSSGELQDRIFSASESADTLSTLDIEGVSGKRLSFKL